MTSERTSAPERQSGIDRDPAMEAAITAKVEAAVERGIDITSAAFSLNGEDPQAIYDQMGFTPEETAYMSRRGLHEMVLVEIGSIVIGSMRSVGLRIKPEDVLDGINAYLQAVKDGNATPPDQIGDEIEKSVITPAIEARVLTDLVKSFGIDICIAEETGEPFFGFSEESTMEAAALAERVTERFRTEPTFKAAMYKVAKVRGNVIPPQAQHVETAAEKLCGQLDECGFLVGITYSGPAPAKPAVVFERYGLLASEVETLSVMDAIQSRFTDEPGFADDLLNHCINMGAIYDERRPVA